MQFELQLSDNMINVIDNFRDRSLAKAVYVPELQEWIVRSEAIDGQRCMISAGSNQYTAIMEATRVATIALLTNETKDIEWSKRGVALIQKDIVR